jgi:hypothetical protein
VILELLATLCAGLFAGAAAYVSFVEHPARTSCGPEVAVAEFGPSYRRGAVMQASLAGICLLASIAAWVESRCLVVLGAGVVIGLAIPYTLLAILPTNKRLLDPGLDPRSAEAVALLRRWGRLHAVRTAQGAVALAMLAWRLAQRS